MYFQYNARIIIDNFVFFWIAILNNTELNSTASAQEIVF